MTENKDDQKIWKYNTMTRNGAHSLAKIMRDMFGCKIISEPTKNKQELWEFKFTNPLLKKEK